MVESGSMMAQEIARAAHEFERQRTGHGPESVGVVISGETLVITVRGALSPAEKALAQTPGGAAQLREFHRQLFMTSSDDLRREIERITGVEVRDSVASADAASGRLAQVFPTGTMVQVFLLAESVPYDAWTGRAPAAAP